MNSDSTISKSLFNRNFFSDESSASFFNSYIFVMQQEQAFLKRAELLLGTSAIDEIANKNIILFGVGGVGSWCAESLVRSGIQKLTLVDSDFICITNVNRQLMATQNTVGQVKVNALRERLLQINPSAEINARQEIFSPETANDFHLENYDYIIDAIDSLNDKVQLILEACKTKATLFSSMGAALKLDPTKIRVAEFWKVQGCPLARALRNKFRSSHRIPSRPFQAVYSEELLQNKGAGAYSAESQDGPNPGWSSGKAQTNGSLVHITAIFGFTIAGLILKDIVNKAENKSA